MTKLPTSVPRSEVLQALGHLGVPVEELLSVTLERRRITVVQIRTDDEGRRMAAGDEIATVTTTVGILDP